MDIHGLKTPSNWYFKWNVSFINWIYLEKKFLLWIRTRVIFCLVVAFQILKTTNFPYHLIASGRQSCNSMKTTCLRLFNFHKRVVGVILKVKSARIVWTRLIFARIIFRFYGFLYFPQNITNTCIPQKLIRAKQIKKNLWKMRLERTKLKKLIFAIVYMFFSLNNKTKNGTYKSLVFRLKFMINNALRASVFSVSCFFFLETYSYTFSPRNIYQD